MQGRRVLIYRRIGAFWCSHKLKYSAPPPSGGW